MYARTLPLALALVLLLLAGAARPAEAQLLDRMKKRAEQAIKDKANRKAEEAADKAVDKAVDEATADLDSAASREIDRTIGPASGAGASGGGSVETVDFRELKAMLPEAASGLKRTDARGEKGAALGIRTSSAEGEYEGGKGTVRLTISDLGSLRGLAGLSYAWIGMEVDQEDEDGFERTTKFKGFPAMEKSHRSDDYVENDLTVVVGERFIVSAEGENVGMDVVRALVERVDLAKLEGLKDFGVQEGDGLVDFRELKALLPASALGQQGTLSGEKGSAMGISASTATGRYEKGDRYVTVTITDSNLGNGLMSLAAWSLVQVDRETETGYERTTKFGGYPAYEKTNKEGGVQSEMQVTVGSRFLVQVQGNVGIDEIKSVLSQIDLAKLETLKGAGAAESK